MTAPRAWLSLGDMVWNPQRLDPDRRRRRLEVLAELASAKALRERTGLRRVGALIVPRVPRRRVAN
ncbi:hypothetical protein GCM10009681_19760 [Luedemannella helvata]|uniref:Uncharacterized protein n=2 Tax=Luedemannella helvata TaxID=349315 RepID=A0ABP4W752_9ACTN